MAILPQSAQPGRWTIHNKDGAAALEFDTFLGVDSRSESRVPTEPVEEGGFAAFNKVKTPQTLTVRLAKSGADLSAFILALEALEDSLELYSVVTPDRVYESMTIVSVNYARRAETGVDRLVVDLGISKIRQIAPAYQQGQAKQGGDASTQSRGKQQSSAATDAQQKRTSTLYKAVY